MEPKPAHPQKEKLLAVQPGEYLSQGFFDSKGEIRDQINTLFSLAMADRLIAEGLKPEEIHKITDKLEETFDKNAARFEKNDASPLNQDAISALQDARSNTLVTRSDTLSKIFDAARPWLKDWRNLSAFVNHVERITEQMAILQDM